MKWGRWLPELATFQIIGNLALMGLLVIYVHHSNSVANENAQAQIAAVQAQTIEARNQARCSTIILLDVLRGIARQSHLDVSKIPTPNADGLNCRRALLQPLTNSPFGTPPPVRPINSPPARPTPSRSPPPPSHRPSPSPTPTCILPPICIPTS